VVIDNFYVVGISVTPVETDTPLVIDANAVLALPIPVKRFETVCRRNTQVLERNRPIQHAKSSKSRPLDILRELFRKSAVEDSLGFLAAKRAYHDARL
jgi:hypothetical protein